MKRIDCVIQLERAGFNHFDAMDLRRISMTLHRWHELECGDDRDFAVERDETTGKTYWTYDTHAADGKRGRSPIPDRERGALKRLAAIMARYPNLTSYVQGDPRGAALYILRPEDLLPGCDVNSCYSRGIAVYK